MVEAVDVFETGAKAADLERFSAAIGHRATATSLDTQAVQLKREADQLDREHYIAPINVSLEVIHHNQPMTVQMLTGGDHFPLRWKTVDQEDQSKYGVQFEEPKIARFSGNAVRHDPKTHNTWIYRSDGEVRVKWEKGTQVIPWVHDFDLEYADWSNDNGPGIHIRLSKDEYLIFSHVTDRAKRLQWSASKPFREIAQAVATRYPASKMSVSGESDVKDGPSTEAEDLLSMSDIWLVRIDFDEGSRLCISGDEDNNSSLSYDWGEDFTGFDFPEIVELVNATASDRIKGKADDVTRLLSPFIPVY